VVPSVELAVRCRSSEVAVQVGGDWFDVIPLPAGAVGLVMGDVEGHDSAAAALMGLIRSAVRAYAVEDHPPAVIMDLANQFLAGLRRGRMVTGVLLPGPPAGGSSRR
jgi:serine phosphatase RsbU (regulator of sigma subunit)